MNLQESNAEKIYEHYGVHKPAFHSDPSEVEYALNSIKENDPYLSRHCDILLEYLRAKNISIQDFILKDLMPEMLSTTDLPSTSKVLSYRKIFNQLCRVYRVTKASIELCIIPDLRKYIDPHNLNLIEPGLAEAYLGVYPCSIMPGKSRDSIEIDLSVPVKLIPPVKEYLAFRRNHAKEKGRHVDTTTLADIWHAIRRLLIGLEIKEYKELDGLEGAQKLQHFYEAKRVKETKKGKTMYQLKANTSDIALVRKFINTMYHRIGISENPCKVKDPNDLNPDDEKRNLYDTMDLPTDRSEYFNRKTERHQTKVKIDDDSELFTSPCFEWEEMQQIYSYLLNKYKDYKLDIGNLHLSALWDLHDQLQEDFILAFGAVNGPRPVDYFAMNVEDIGDFSTRVDDPRNRRFFTSIQKIENNVRLAPNKIRPAKRFFGIVFTIFALLYEVRQTIVQKKHQKVERSKYSNMIREGEPMLVHRWYRRGVIYTITKHFRKVLVRAGINKEKEGKATLYWMRKSFITHATEYGMDIEDVSQITGTDPTTLYKFYVQLDKMKDADAHYAGNFLKPIGFLPKEYMPEKQNNKISENPLCPNVERSFPTSVPPETINCETKISKGDRCGLQRALKIVGVPKKRLLAMAAKNLISGQKIGGRWEFSKKSLSQFKEKYIDINTIAKYLSISQRRAQQIIKSIKKKTPAKATLVGNRIYILKEAFWKIYEAKKINGK